MVKTIRADENDLYSSDIILSMNADEVKNGESNREFDVHLMDLQSQWLQECHPIEKVKEEVGLEHLRFATYKEKGVSERLGD